MLKKHFFILAIIVIPVVTFSQSCSYNQYLTELGNRGYTISKDMGETKVNLKEGESMSALYHTFTGGDDYIIVASSDDGAVTDVDAYLYDADNNLIRKDADDNPLAVVSFHENYTASMKIVIKNYASNTPNFASTCRVIIAYK